MPMILHDSGDVTVQSVLPGFLDECVTMFYCKDDLKIELGIGVGHDELGCGAPFSKRSTLISTDISRRCR